MRISIKDAIRRGWLSPEEARASSLKGGTRNRGKNKREIEGEEQALLIKMVRARFPVEGLLLIHIPNGGSRRNSFEGWRLKEQGVRAGVSDLFLPVARGRAHGLWIEFKAAAPNTSPVTEAQKEWLELMRDQGYEAHLCVGVNEAFDVLVKYLTQED